MLAVSRLATGGGLARLDGAPEQRVPRESRAGEQCCGAARGVPRTRAAPGEQDPAEPDIRRAGPHRVGHFGRPRPHRTGATTGQRRLLCGHRPEDPTRVRLGGGLLGRCPIRGGPGGQGRPESVRAARPAESVRWVGRPSPGTRRFGRHDSNPSAQRSPTQARTLPATAPPGSCARAALRQQEAPPGRSQRSPRGSGRRRSGRRSTRPDLLPAFLPRWPARSQAP
jgi:hypothetical protein